MSPEELKAKLVQAHRDQDWAEAARLSAIKSEQTAEAKVRAKGKCVDCGVTIEQDAVRCSMHARQHWANRHAKRICDHDCLQCNPEVRRTCDLPEKRIPSAYRLKHWAAMDDEIAKFPELFAAKTIQNVLGVSNRQVHIWIDSAVARGWVIRVKRGLCMRTRAFGQLKRTGRNLRYAKDRERLVQITRE